MTENLHNRDAEKVSVIIIAGGAPDAALLASQGVPHYGLVEIAGSKILLRTLQAFQKTPLVAETIVVGTPEILQILPAGAQALEAAETPAQNISLGLEAAHREWVVVATADIPWLRAEIVGEFLAAAQSAKADLVYPIVSKEVYNAAFPGGRRTYVTLREGTFTGGNLVWAGKSFMQGQLPLIHRLFENRKNPLAIACLLGPGFIFRLLTRTLDISSLERRGCALTGGRVAALPFHRPEIAFDIDKPEDLEAAQRCGPPG